MAHIGRSLFFALAAGAAGGAVATLLSRENGNNKRSVAKSAVRTGIRFYDRLRGAVGEMTETMSDVVAEVQSEIETERSGAKPDGAQAPKAHESAQEHVVPFGAKPEAERTAHG